MVNVVPWTHYLYAGLAGFFLSVAGYAAWLLIHDIVVSRRPQRITLPVWNFQSEEDHIRIIQESVPYDWAQEETE